MIVSYFVNGAVDPILFLLRAPGFDLISPLILFFIFLIFLLLDQPLQKSLRRCRFKSDRDEIWHKIYSRHRATFKAHLKTELFSAAYDTV